MKLPTQQFIYMICTLVLFLKMYITATMQGFRAAKVNQRTKEDYEKLKIKQPLNGDDPQAKEEAFRWQRIVMNDLENIPICLAVFWAAHFQGASAVLVITIITFTILRILFTICYAKGLQPYRSLAFILGIFCTITAGVTGVINAADHL